MRFNRRWLWLLLLIFLLVIGGFVVWAGTPQGTPMAEALAAMKSGMGVQVTDDRWLVFQPTSTKTETGFIFYPGGKVPPEAYAPAGQAIAEAGYLMVIVPMPLNLAVLDPGRADEVIQTYTSIKHWAIGGHSLGGTMAARFANDHPKMVQGLVLWAAYPESNVDMFDRTDLVAVSIYGTRDGLCNDRDIEYSRLYLPQDTRFVEIEGGNHAQFGWYGPQPGDNEASISRLEQHNQIIAATVAVLEQISRE